MIPIPAGNTYNKKEVDSISTQRKPAPEQAKKELAEQLWLSYYNQVLFEAGLITETERNRMKNKISALTPSASTGWQEHPGVMLLSETHTCLFHTGVIW